MQEPVFVSALPSPSTHARPVRCAHAMPFFMPLPACGTRAARASRTQALSRRARARLAPWVIAAALPIAPISHASDVGSLRLHGNIDNGIGWVSHQGDSHGGHGSSLQMMPSSRSSNKLIIDGSEPIDADTSAVFTLSNGFNIHTGALAQEGRLFNREASVGLSHRQYGTLTLGRQPEPGVDLLSGLTADDVSGLLITPGDIDNTDGSVRLNNAIKWTSVDMNGLQLALLYALGGVTDSRGSGQAYSGALTYRMDATTVGLGYFHIDNGNARKSQRGVSTADSIFNSPINAAYASSATVDIWRAALKQDVGPFTGGVSYSLASYRPDGDSSFGRTERFQQGSTFLTWRATPQFDATLAYTRLYAAGDSHAHYDQIGTTLTYSLSPRTSLYALTAYNHADGENGQGRAQASIGSSGIGANSRTQTIAALGMQHAF